MDRTVKIWKENPQDQKFVVVAELNSRSANSKQAHDDWVRDVAWCSNVGVMQDIIATVGEDHKVRIWKSD